jgi:hypothetical protein
VSLTLHQSATLIGGHCWIERRLFERLGSWVAPLASAQAKLLLDSHSQHAAWRAAQWWDRLPVLAQLDRDEQVAPADDWAAMLAGAGGEVDPDLADVSHLAVAYRVLLPRLAARYARHARLASPTADGAVIRTLALVAADVRADWAQGEFLLEELVSSAAHAAAAASAVAETEWPAARPGSLA